MNKAKRNSHLRCADTCPDVTYAFETLLDRLAELVPTMCIKDMQDAVSDCETYIKDNGTYKLRDALTDVCQELIDMIEERDVLAERLRQFEQ